MTRNNDRDDPTGSYHDLSTPPSAHHDPPARALGSTAPAEATGADEAFPAAGRAPSRRPRALDADPLSYDTVSPRTGPASRSGKTKWAVAGVAVVAAAIGWFLLPRFGWGPGNGKGGTGPGNGGASPHPPAVVQSTPPPAPLLSNPQPATAPASTTGPLPVPPSGPLHLTIQGETIHVGGSEGPAVSVDQAVEMAKGAKLESPVVIDLKDSSRALPEEQLKAAFERQQIPLLWTKDGKPVTGDLPGTRVEPPQP